MVKSEPSRQIIDLTNGIPIVIDLTLEDSDEDSGEGLVWPAMDRCKVELGSSPRLFVSSTAGCDQLSPLSRHASNEDEHAVSAGQLDVHASPCAFADRLDTHHCAWTFLLRSGPLSVFLGMSDTLSLGRCCTEFQTLSHAMTSELKVMLLIMNLGIMDEEEHLLLARHHRIEHLNRCVNPKCSVLFRSPTNAPSGSGHCSMSCYLSYLPGCYKCNEKFQEFHWMAYDYFGYRCYPQCKFDVVSFKDDDGAYIDRNV